MDIDTVLSQIRDLSKYILKCADEHKPIDESDAIELAEATLALDEWIVKGGFLPDAWQNNRA